MILQEIHVCNLCSDEMTSEELIMWGYVGVYEVNQWQAEIPKGKRKLSKILERDGYIYTHEDPKDGRLYALTECVYLYEGLYILCNNEEHLYDKN